MAAYGMDRNERLLSRIQQERSSHGRLLGVRSDWLLVGSVVLVVTAAAAGFRLAGVSGAGEEPLVTPRSADEALTSGFARTDRPNCSASKLPRRHARERTGQHSSTPVRRAAR